MNFSLPSYKAEVTYKNEDLAEKFSWIPGAKRSRDRSVSFEAHDFMEVLKFLHFALD